MKKIAKNAEKNPGIFADSKNVRNFAIAFGAERPK